jgi:hypothetical protein
LLSLSLSLHSTAGHSVFLATEVRRLMLVFFGICSLPTLPPDIEVTTVSRDSNPTVSVVMPLGA